MVPRKLSSALVTLFLHFPRQWHLCIKSLCVSLTSQGSWQIDDSVHTDSALSSLQLPQLQAVLWFSTGLVEETAKTDMNSNRQ